MLIFTDALDFSNPDIRSNLRCILVEMTVPVRILPRMDTLNHD
jgi:hypothetical protein